MFHFPRPKTGKQGTWQKALSLFFIPIFIFMALRWLLYEPFVIPSESMVPNLLVHDHLVVSKYAYGIKWPFLDGWLWMYSQPKRGDIVVFRYPKNRNVFYIKRLVGLPGDKVTFQNGQIAVNDEPWSLESLDNLSTEFKWIDPDPDFSFFIESVAGGSDSKHIIRRQEVGEHLDSEEKTIKIQPGHYFLVGDNRDQSHDSRYWGTVPEGNIVGKASTIWLSCTETMASAPFLCNILNLRLDRLFKKIQ